ncbi:hypothetical protein PENARI_c106G05511 [Penicillium arizonense]|uniref:Uncharacterized protein n=1 Tax=Penicillium arizonense TaxID=1835702 RepID=A0A1F5L1G6_PENAI|nr:hypothetical protein PENARI_c106G05511 [Penicillium arizonense]OGE46809.1 hypothetical protein PENARI_c106G05511 [Penicillium arizonense]
MSAGSLGANAVSRGATTSMPTIKRTANVGAAIVEFRATAPK